MKRRISGALLSLLLLLSLTGCGQLPEAVTAPGSGSYDRSADLSLPAPETGSQEANTPQADQSPGGVGSTQENPGRSDENNRSVDEEGWYTSKEEVALYIHLYGQLPGNYVTKEEAKQSGWTGGNVERYTGQGTAIGGSYFGNYEGLLPKAPGRSYAECDIDTPGENTRGAKRIVYSNDGLIYYTEDHYESFELLYGTP